MNRSMLSGLAAIALLAVSLAASAQDAIPEIKGKWVGQSQSIIAGRGGHWPTSRGVFAKPALGEKEVTLHMAGQEDRRFWGVTILSGGGEKTSEPFVGMLIGKDNRTVLIADTDGYYNGELSEDGGTLSVCYAHAGGKTKTSVVACVELKRVQ